MEQKEKEKDTLLNKFKEQYKDVYELQVGDFESKNIKIGYFRKPTFTEFRMIYPLIAKGDDIMADRRLLEICWLGGDEDIINVDENIDIFLSIRAQLGQLIEIQVATLKKK